MCDLSNLCSSRVFLDVPVLFFAIWIAIFFEVQVFPFTICVFKYAIFFQFVLDSAHCISPLNPGNSNTGTGVAMSKARRSCSLAPAHSKSPGPSAALQGQPGVDGRPLAVEPALRLKMRRHSAVGGGCAMSANLALPVEANAALKWKAPTRAVQESPKPCGRWVVRPPPPRPGKLQFGRPDFFFQGRRRRRICSLHGAVVGGRATPPPPG